MASEMRRAAQILRPTASDGCDFAHGVVPNVLGPPLARASGMSLQHTVVWIDHQEARIFGVSRGSLEEKTVSAPTHHVHRHPKGPTAERHHPGDTTHFFHDVASVISSAGELLLVGPSTAKLQFLRYVAKEAPALEAKVVGIETVDHPTDGQLIAYARTYFRLPQGGVG